jgi:hypothetical protein
MVCGLRALCDNRRSHHLNPKDTTMKKSRARRRKNRLRSNLRTRAKL